MVRPARTVLSDDAAEAALALERELALQTEVIFALAWEPGPASAVHVRAVTANGNHKLHPAGVLDTESPFSISIGHFAKGSTVQIGWSVRTYADLNGIRAFARTADAAVWVTLEDKIPLAFQQEWSSMKPFKVPA